MPYTTFYLENGRSVHFIFSQISRQPNFYRKFPVFLQALVCSTDVLMIKGQILLSVLQREMLYSAFSLTGLKSTARPFVKVRKQLMSLKAYPSEINLPLRASKDMYGVPEGRSVLYFAQCNRAFIWYGWRSPYSCSTKNSRSRNIRVVSMLR